MAELFRLIDKRVVLLLLSGNCATFASCRHQHNMGIAPPMMIFALLLCGIAVYFILR